MRLLDEGGVEGLTMRRLGEALHVSAPTLYWHVRDREEVLDLAYDAIFGELPAPETGDSDWRPAARRWLLAIRAMVIRHPWWAQLRPTRPAVGPQALRATGGLVELLVAAGLARSGLEAALTLMTDFAVGATATSVQFRRWLDAPEADVEAVRTYVIDAAKPWPAWSAHINNHLVGSDPDRIREQTFDAAIEALLNGVASLVQTQPQKSGRLSTNS
jgi:AcrR family transcriptional regulator